jgi:ribosomal protein S4
MKRKNKFYSMILNILYNGIKFFFKRYSDKSFLFFMKKRIRFFYNFLAEKTIGKLGKLVRRKNGELIDFFYSLLERRLDILLIRSLYTNTMRDSRNLIFMKLVFVNTNIISKPYYLVLIGNYVKVLFYPKNYFFFQYYYPLYDKDFEILHFYRNKIFDIYQKLFFRVRQDINFINNFLKIILAVDLNKKLNYDLQYILAALLRSTVQKKIKRILYKLVKLKKYSIFLESNSIEKNYIYKNYRPIDFNILRLLSLRLYKIVMLFIEFKLYLQIYGSYKCKMFTYKKFKLYLHAYILRRYKYIKIKRQKNLDSNIFEYAYHYLFFPLGYKKNLLKKKFVKYLRTFRVKKDFIKNLNLLRFAFSTLLYMNYYSKNFSRLIKKKEFLKLYGLINLRLRVKFLYRLLLPRFGFNKNNSMYLFLEHMRFKKIKRFRIWKFSYNVYLYFKKLKDVVFIYKGYPGYLEINYKIHSFILIKLPQVNEITYPFTIDKFIVYDYFRRRGYF